MRLTVTFADPDLAPAVRLALHQLAEVLPEQLKIGEERDDSFDGPGHEAEALKVLMLQKDPSLTDKIGVSRESG